MPSKLTNHEVSLLMWVELLMSSFTLFKKHCSFLNPYALLPVTGDAAESQQDLSFYFVLVICFKGKNNLYLGFLLENIH